MKVKVNWENDQYALVEYRGERIGNIHFTMAGWCGEYYNGDEYKRLYSEYFAECLVFLLEQAGAPESVIQKAYEEYSDE